MNNVSGDVSTPVIRATAVCRRNPANEDYLLHNVDLELSQGQRIAIVGPSGSGKTLLLRALAMLDPLDRGQINWHGSPVTDHDIPRYRSRVIYLHQRAPLTEGTVERNLRQPLSLRAHRQRQFDRKRIVSVLKMLGRDESFLAKQQRDLSGGEAQIAALLRAIQLEPEVLLLDEPTAALDASATAMTETLVETWMSDRSERRATVWVTHDSRQGRRVASKLLRMDQGRLRELN